MLTLKDISSIKTQLYIQSYYDGYNYSSAQVRKHSLIEVKDIVIIDSKLFICIDDKYAYLDRVSEKIGMKVILEDKKSD